jgi:5-methylcytosine-specific restriction protein B
VGHELGHRIDRSHYYLNTNHNLILTGAPGTGKTHLAHDIAEAMGAKEGSEQYAFVQFHPSYDYTDFVEGLRPTKPDANGNIGFERRDGVFKEFCKKALLNLRNSNKTQENIVQEASVQEKVNDFLNDAIDTNKQFETKTGTKFYVKDVSDTFINVVAPDNKVASDLKLSLSDLIDLLANNISLDNVKNIREHFERQFNTQQDSYVFTLCKEIRKIKSSSNVQQEAVQRKNFVFIIDEINRGEISKIFGELFFSIDPDYRGAKGTVMTQYQNLVDDGDVFKRGFFVPENVYIIGTMNDIDRSVESMDFAIRRRFAWQEVDVTDRVDTWVLKRRLRKEWSDLTRR